MKFVTVGIGEWAISRDTDEALKTFALGSCVAVLIYDTKVRVAGLIHIALPESSINPDLARTSPGRFADTGLPLMIEDMKAMGVTRAHVWVKLAGGSAIMDPIGHFDIGRRNVLAVKRHLWKSSLGPVAEDIGGDISRTVSINVVDGGVSLVSGNRTWNL
jgi:chemotaxis protein CheD